jgi:integrase
MATVKIRHLVERGGRWYFQPTRAMKNQGFQPLAFGDDIAEALATTQRLNEEWDAVRKRGPAAPGEVPGTVKWLIRDYKCSDWFTDLAPRTREEVDRHIERIDAALGRVHVATLRRRHVRRFHEKLMRARSRRQANEGVKWLRRMLSYAVEIELRKDNPALRMELKHAKPRRVVWTPEQVEQFKTTAINMGRLSWALAVQLGYDTAADLSDILRLTWNDYDGEGVTFRRSKTDTALWVPLQPEGIRMLSETERRAVQIIVGDVKGRPIAHRSFFGRVFREIRSKAGLSNDLRFRDLRRTVGTEISSGGGQIHPITGHQPGSTVIKHYIVPNKDAARNAQAARGRNEK